EICNRRVETNPPRRNRSYWWSAVRLPEWAQYDTRLLRHALTLRSVDLVIACRSGTRHAPTSSRKESACRVVSRGSSYPGESFSGSASSRSLVLLRALSGCHRAP